MTICRDCPACGAKKSVMIAVKSEGENVEKCIYCGWKYKALPEDSEGGPQGKDKEQTYFQVK